MLNAHTPRSRAFVAVAFAAGLLAYAPARAASFDCSRAGAANEKIICNDAELSALDDKLGRAFKQARQRAADRRAFTAQSDRQWRWREQNCRDRACLLGWYQRRQTELEASAATSIADAVRLPAATPAPALAQVIPVAAPLRLNLDNAQIAGVAPAGAMPWPHYLRMERGQYLYADPQGGKDATVAVRYYGVENGQYIIEANRGDAVLRYTCSADCAYIGQLALPGDVEKDMVIVRNDSSSLPSLIVNDAVNGLLAQSSVR